MDESLVKRFWSKVEKTNGCWIWVGSKDNYGRGRIQGLVKGKRRMLKASRVSYQLHNGPIPEDKWILHKCDNKICVNPDHLELGTPSKNTQDAYARGRMKKGEDCSFSKLTNDQVREIRSSSLSSKELSVEYSVSRSLINQIKRNSTRKD